MAKVLNEVLIRCNSQGAFQGAHVVYGEAYTLPSGQTGFELYSPEPLTKAGLAAIAPMINAVLVEESANVRSELDEAKATIAILQQEKIALIAALEAANTIEQLENV